jgi:3-oxoadipyl-CoA thiolase
LTVPGPRAVVVDALRTPVGRFGGALAGIRPDDLAATVITALAERRGLFDVGVDDVFWGAANQAGEDNRDVARMAALVAGLPATTPGVTVNRLCGSGLEAVVQAGRAIAVGDARVAIAGGSESMSRAPAVVARPSRAYERGLRTADTTVGWRFPNPRLTARWGEDSLGQTAENVAAERDVDRRRQDEFALTSHRRAVAAADAGRFDAELVPVVDPGGPDATPVTVDETPRRDTSPEALAGLRPAFKEGGTVTAGNSSGLNDGAAGLLLAAEEEALERGWEARARILSSAVAGVEPRVMGLGPIPATRLALERAGLTVEDLDLIELNEAFAAQAVACIDELGLDPERVNVNGGAIALGHPLGSSGARLVTTLVHELRRRGGGIGLATMCIGVGQGIAAVLEVPRD